MKILLLIAFGWVTLFILGFTTGDTRTTDVGRRDQVENHLEKKIQVVKEEAVAGKVECWRMQEDPEGSALEKRKMR
jgi:hypothetical protein